MLNPLDYLTDTKKDRIIDGALTRLASAAESAGSNRLAESLRKLRNDTPFIEDVAAGLGRALTRFSEEWEAIDPEVVAAVQEGELWESGDLLGDLCTILMRPMAISGPEFRRMADAFCDALPGIADERVTEALTRLIAIVREELFVHPHLQGVHKLYLQIESANREAAILEELRAIHQDNTTVLTYVASQLTQASQPAISSDKHELDKDKLPLIAGGGDSRTLRRIEVLDEPLPDILTPSIDSAGALTASYAPLVGEEAALWLQKIQSDITLSIETADFEMQAAIAGRLLENDLGIRELAASGHYIRGEAQRLQADFVNNSVDRDRLLDAALESYGIAAELNPSSARSQRGLGRVYEVKGDVGKALNLYSRARLKALAAFAESGEPPSSEAAHEVLRSTRHYASCMSQSLAANLLGPSARDSSIRQLHGVILESEDLHRSILPRFAAQSDWMYIEWFMGLVLLAKSYSVVEDVQHAWVSLLYALSARMAMMDPNRSRLSSVERDNLTWWCNTAKAVKLQNASSRNGVERLAEGVARDDASMVWINMQDLVWPVQAPWSPRMGRKPA